MRKLSKARAQAFAGEFIAAGFNASKAIERLDPHITSRQYKANKGSRTLRHPEVQKALGEMLRERSFTDSEIDRILFRNANQSKNIAASNTAVDIALKVRGDYAPERTLTMGITANIRDETEADAVLKELQQQIHALTNGQTTPDTGNK